MAPRHPGIPSPAAPPRAENGPREGESESDERAHAMPSKAAAVHEIICEHGEKELRRDALALLWSALAGGITMSTSLVGEGVLMAYLPKGDPFFLVSTLGYPLGFILVITASQQLFSENTVTPVLPVMTKPSLYGLWRLARLWMLVLAGNLAGAAVAAWVFAELPVFPPPVDAAFQELGHHLMASDAFTMFSKAILSGWLIATLVWVLTSIDQGKVLMIFLVTYLMGLGDFPHIIVGSVEVFYLMFLGKLAVGDALWTFGVPTLLGNLLGGTLIFALISHAQVRNDID